MTSLGSFRVSSGKLTVSDPCYSPGTWCAGVVDNVKNGVWEAAVNITDDTGGWGERCAELIAWHKSIKRGQAENASERCSFEVGVDSGQAGIFDTFKGGEDDYGEGGWYDECCKLTLNKPGAGVLKGGCVSSSGYGDGGYECFILRDKEGECVAVKVVFIDEEEKEECYYCGSEYCDEECREDYCDDCGEDHDYCECE